jgi:histidinol-phosphate aminotransferase
VRGIVAPTKLSSNESPLGPSPKTKKAYIGAADKLHLYPDGSSVDLSQALADHYGLEAGRIVCGNGSDDILYLLGQAYLQPGNEVIYTEHGFLLYKLIAQVNAAVPVVAPETNYTADPELILKAVTPKTKIIFLANPNNPTGTFVSADALARLRTELDERILLVIDAAYADYVRRNDYEPGIELVRHSPSVVMTRTFSKLYGLAGIRLGWCYCSVEIANYLNRIRGPFNVNLPAQAAGIAALRDTAHVEAAITHNETWRPWLAEQLSALGLMVTPSIANFVLIHFGVETGKTAQDADRFLQTKGLILRAMSAYGLPHCLRMTVGLEKDNHAVVSALKEFTDK